MRHLFSPLLASTLTTILGFMPIFLLPGNVGDFVGPSLLFTPAVYYLLHRPSKAQTTHRAHPFANGPYINATP